LNRRQHPRGTQSETATAWVFKAAESHWRAGEFLRTVDPGDEFLWYFAPRPDLVSVGQRVYLWQASVSKPGIVALARTLGPVIECEDHRAEFWTETGLAKLGGVRPRVPLRLEHVLTRPLTKVQIQLNADLKDRLKDLSVLRWYAQQTNFPVQADEEIALDAACLRR
jgi:hypothetical protein